MMLYGAGNIQDMLSPMPIQKVAIVNNKNLPSNVFRPTVEHVSPKCVGARFIRIQLPVRINESITEQIRHSCAFFVSKAGILSIGFRIG